MTWTKSLSSLEFLFPSKISLWTIDRSSDKWEDINYFFTSCPAAAKSFSIPDRAEPIFTWSQNIFVLSFRCSDGRASLPFPVGERDLHSLVRFCSQKGKKREKEKGSGKECAKMTHEMSEYNVIWLSAFCTVDHKQICSCTVRTVNFVETKKCDSLILWWKLPVRQ